MTLDDYKKSKDWTYQKLSDELGIPLTTVYSICKGTHCINMRIAATIVERTGGRVWWTDLLNSLDC